MNLPNNLAVRVNLGTEQFEGIVVGKATTDLTQSHIIKCTDGFLPNDTYMYDTCVVPLQAITVEGD